MADNRISPKGKGRPPKRVRSVAELEALAAKLGADWYDGDNVMTWIRRHEGNARELSKLVKDGWSWADVGRALALAGITYAKGTPITAKTLSRKAWDARKAARLDLIREAGASPSLEPWRPDEQAPSRAAMRDDVMVPNEAATKPPSLAEPEPRFKFIRRTGDGYKPTKTEPAPTRPSEELAEIDQATADEVFMSMFGRLPDGQK